MAAWLDFLLLALALTSGWLGFAALLLSGWRPLPARPRPYAAPRRPYLGQSDKQRQ